MHAIEAVGLVKSFGQVRVLDDVSFTVAPGSVTALLGPNGAGKTTLINIVSTLIKPDAGTGRVFGRDVVEQADEIRGLISVTGQSVAVDPLLTGVENLRLTARLAGLDRTEAASTAASLVDQFDLGEAATRRVRTYSGGQRRRLDLALGLVVRPQLIFLDEPTTGLDPVSRDGLWKIIGDLAADGVSVLLTTQYLEEADHLADRVILISGGRIAAEGSPARLKALVGQERIEVRRAGDDSLVASAAVDGSPSSVRDALDRIGWAGDGYVVLRKPTLDDVFRQVTTQDAKAVA